MKYYYEQRKAVDGIASQSGIVAAAAAGRFNELKELLRQGADIDSGGGNDETALHWAAARGDARMVKLLIKYGAMASDFDESGHTPADVAVEFGHEALAEKLDQIRQQEPYTRDEIYARRQGVSDRDGPGS